ncbi:MAG: efflux RND transporter periplasmic adaptor subunit [Planctomycetota bacterium]
MLTALVGIVLLLWLGSLLPGPLAKVWAAFRPSRTEVRTASSHAPLQYYTCGMHPWVIESHPGDCPICGMPLTPIDSAKFSGEVTIDPVVAQNIGIRVAAVTEGPVTRTVRTVGTIAYDDTRVRDVDIKVGGWIEKLDVDYQGEQVEVGQALFDLYSPELYAAQEEYLVAWRAVGQLDGDTQSESARSARAMLAAAHTKLDFFDVTPAQIAALQARGTPAKTMTVQSPYHGVVIEKSATEGMKVSPGTQIYRIADLSKVWVMVTLYEYQLPYVEVGQAATMQLTYLPGQRFQGTVTYIYPYISDKTHQVVVRMAFDNPVGLLKPGMFATVDLQSVLAKRRTLAPRSAIIDTGERKVAFVSLGDGHFEPRRVVTGAEAQDDMVEVLSGLKPGELVVTSGEFLIDSEANVREALAKMIRGTLSVGQPATVEVEPTGVLPQLPVPVAQDLCTIVNRYLEIQADLANDKMAGVASPAGVIAQTVDNLLKEPLPAAPHFWQHHQETATLRGKALELAQAKNIDDARLDFADLSFALDRLLRATGVPSTFGRELQELHCPMFRAGQGGTIWLQSAGEVRNPYFGSMMLGCFDKRVALPVTGQATTDAAKPEGSSAAPDERRAP